MMNHNSHSYGIAQNGYRAGHVITPSPDGNVHYRPPTHAYECGLPQDATWKKSPKVKCTLMSLKFLNGFGITYCIVVLSIVFFTGIKVILPCVYQESPELIPSRLALALYLCLNVVLNYILTLVYTSYYEPKKHQSAGLVDGNWKDCLDCKLLIPPRAHHCSLCRGCILKRDHHCFFSGCCIGFYNQRYFVAFLFHVMLGGIYCMYMLSIYIDTEYPHLYQGSSWYSYFYHFFLPITIGEWLFGSLGNYETFYIVLAYLIFASAFGATTAFHIEMYLICRGITAYELGSGSTLTRKNKLSENLKGVFGNYWVLNFFCPLPWIKPKGNGIDWYSTTKYV